MCFGECRQTRTSCTPHRLGNEVVLVQNAFHWFDLVLADEPDCVVNTCSYTPCSPSTCFTVRSLPPCRGDGPPRAATPRLSTTLSRHVQARRRCLFPASATDLLSREPVESSRSRAPGLRPCDHRFQPGISSTLARSFEPNTFHAGAGWPLPASPAPSGDAVGAASPTSNIATSPRRAVRPPVGFRTSARLGLVSHTRAGCRARGRLCSRCGLDRPKPPLPASPGPLLGAALHRFTLPRPEAPSTDWSHCSAPC